MTRAATKQPKTTSDYRTDFLKILNNTGKMLSHEQVTSDPKTTRLHGFVVLVRGGSNLKPIQSLCFDQTYNECLTARYRLRPASAIGTLIVAHLADLTKIARGEKDLTGDLEPSFTEDAWKRIAQPYLENPTGNESQLEPMFRAKHGIVAQEKLRKLWVPLLNESNLKKGQRLVLFGELSEEAADVADWQAAIEMLSTYAQLPERVGLVLSGAPKDFSLPEDDPHFLEITLPKEEGAGSGQAQFAYKYTDSSFHRDEPATKDQLEVSDYANALARFVMHPQTQPPLTIGIHGPWGRGKSSFMRLVDGALVKYADINRNVKRSELNGETRTQHWNDLVAKLITAEQSLRNEPNNESVQKECETIRREEAELWNLMQTEAEKNVLSVTFNAWQFEDAKQTWAGLASQISERMEQTLPWGWRQWLRIQYAWKERKGELTLNLLLPLAIACMVAALVILGSFRQIIPPEKIEEPLGVLLRILLPTGSALFTIWLISSQVLKVAQPVSQRVLSYVRMPDYREQMGFQHRVKDDLRFVYKYLNRRRPGSRVVVYIDDLDRCSEDKIMELLQAINLILASCEFFVFVGMDTEMIYRAIKSHYKETPTERKPDSYLRKIIQISFYLQGTMPRADYLTTLFSSTARFELAARGTSATKVQASGEPGSAGSAELPYDLGGLLEIVPVQLKEAEDTADELEAFRDYSDFLDDNPREIKRLINLHRLTKILLQRQDTTWSRVRQRKLIKWLIFCDRWPELVDDVLGMVTPTEIPDILGNLATTLNEAEDETIPPAQLQRLEDFAYFTNGKPGAPLDTLSSKDIDADFRRAANLSQLISNSPGMPGQ